MLFFLCDVIGNSQIKIHDAEVICAHAPGKRYLSVRDLIEYCLAFGWIHLEEDAISVVSSIGEMLHDKDVLNTKLVMSSVDLLFSEGVFDSTMFSYDSLQCSFSFKNGWVISSFFLFCHAVRKALRPSSVSSTAPFSCFCRCFAVMIF